jgi:hypothetical protein
MRSCDALLPQEIYVRQIAEEHSAIALSCVTIQAPRLRFNNIVCSAMRRVFVVLINGGARLRGCRGTLYGITLLYRKNPQPLREDLPQIFALLAAKKIDPLVAATFPLLAARQAIELLATGTVAGKIVLTIRDSALPCGRVSQVLRVAQALMAPAIEAYVRMGL